MQSAQAKEEKIVLKNNTKRAHVAIYVFWAICLVNVVAVFFGYLELELLQGVRDGDFVTDESLEASDVRQGIVGVLQMAAYITSMVVFLNWFRRAYGNLHRIKSDYLDNSEMMTVWGFVIPIISLYKPYRIAKEIMTETQRELKRAVADYSQPPNYVIIRLWWVLFLITNYIGRYAIKSFFKADTIDQLISSSQAYIVSDSVDIFAAVVTILMIKAIAEKECLLFDHFSEAAD